MEHKSVKEFSVKTISVCGFRGAMMALRLPFGLGERSTTNSDVVVDSVASGNDTPHQSIETTEFVCFHQKDYERAVNLVTAGDEHAKVLRGVVVWCEVNAPRYWWQEMATYRIGVECLSSESTMHIQGKNLSTDELVEMKENLREDTMQKRVLMLSYQTLRRIYYQRRNHRLPQWHTFCDWIVTLPFAEDLIIGKKKVEE